MTEAFDSGSQRRLLQRGVDRGELVVQVGAEAVDDGDNGERNAGRDEAIFDGGSAGLSFTKRAMRFFIGVTPCEHVADRTNCGLAGVLSTVTIAET